ncbi:acetolactate synthase-1/2/3 large subunit [Ruminococcaceae bacterium KH2T8]|nr:acetolactate synthase-1/2/3 large subunit [Ruminococcaceae bacterium KH2T8]
MIRVADYILKRIADEGVGHIFYVPGGQCVYLMDALRRSEYIEGIGMHHEQACAMAALSYSLYNNNLGACIVTTGCAGTNTFTGILHAWQDSIPMIVISGQQPYDQTIKASGLPLRQVGIQEADIETLVKPITKYAVTISSADEIAYHIDKAIYLAREGRKGPVWLDVPLNVQNSMINEDKLEHFIPEPSKPEIADSLIQETVDAINGSKRPVFLIGQGVRYAGGVQNLNQMINDFRIPVVFSRFAFDTVSYDNELNFGVVGAGGANRNANFTIQNADLVISIGCRLAIEVTGPERDQFAREAKTIVVDIDDVEHSKKGVHIDTFIHGDAKEFIEKLSAQSITTAFDDWIAKCKHWKEIFPLYPQSLDKTQPIDIKYFLNRMSEYFGESSAVTADAGLTGAVTTGSCKLGEKNRAIASLAQGEMGYALPAAIGVSFLTPDAVYSVNGDGSVMMNLQELQTIVRNDCNIKIIIINNNGYSGVRHGQKAHFRGKSIGTDPSNGLDFPDYSKLAEAFGIKYIKVNSYDEIDECLNRLSADRSPMICEVMCDPEQVDLHNGLVTYGKRKFGFRPIEDQAPYVDRELFFEEMIVKPLDTSYGTPV